MKIAILTTVHPGSDIRVFHKQAVSLAQAGHTVTLYAPFTEGADAKARERGIEYIPLRIDRRRMSRPLRWWQLMVLLRRRSFDAWHFHDPELLPLAVLWKRLFANSVCLIYDAHEDLPKDILDKHWIPISLRKIVAVIADRVEVWGASRCQLLVAATDSIGHRMAGLNQQFIIVRNYPLIDARFSKAREKDSSRPIRVIYAGVLTEVRGVRQVVQAMNKIEDHRAELLLLGVLYPASFEDEIRRISGLNTIIHEKVPYEQVTNYLLSSDIGVVCFHPLPNHIEAMPNKLFEYMQAGLPVIASNFPLWRDIVEQAGCGVLVDPQDPDEIRNAILLLTDDPALRNRMGLAGVKAVREKYSWQYESDTLLKAYAQLDEN